MSMIEMQGIGKTYHLGGVAVRALDEVSLVVERGEFVAIIGPSGCGKSTLMNLIGCLDPPTSGVYILDGVRVDTLDDDALSAIRSRKIGFIFQAFNLLPRATALENVELPLIYRPENGAPLGAAERLLAQVGLGDRIHHLPSELSGGQQQRIAIARALINDPAVILADEPTGALDSRSGVEVIALLQRLNAEGHTVILVTHDPAMAEHARRIVTLRDGHIVSDDPVPAPRRAEEELLQAPPAGYPPKVGGDGGPSAASPPPVEVRVR
jgi:putative ABC transport system ATP-binding protein